MKSSTVEKIERYIAKLQSRGETGGMTSYQIAKDLGLSESTVFYCLKEIRRQARQRLFQDYLDQGFKLVQRLEKEIDGSRAVDTLKKVFQGIVGLVEGGNLFTSSYVAKNSASVVKVGEEAIDSPREKELATGFRKMYKQKYSLVFAPGGLSKKQKSQVKSILKFLDKEKREWKEYLEWGFKVKAKELRSPLSIGFLAYGGVLHEYAYQENKRKELPWLKKK